MYVCGGIHRGYMGQFMRVSRWGCVSGGMPVPAAIGKVRPKGIGLTDPAGAAMETAMLGSP